MAALLTILCSPATETRLDVVIRRGVRYATCVVFEYNSLLDALESHRSRSVEINGVAQRQLSLARWVLLRAAGIASILVSDRLS